MIIKNCVIFITILFLLAATVLPPNSFKVFVKKKQEYLVVYIVEGQNIILFMIGTNENI
jgi:hypothetical protein